MSNYKLRMAIVTGIAVLGLGLGGCPQEAAFPAFLTPPRLHATGPVVKVVVESAPFNLRVTGDAQVERLDDHRIRFKTSSGNVAIALARDEAIYGLTERIVSGRWKSETWVQEVGGLDRRGERVRMWVYPSEAVYAPFYLSSAGYGMFVEGTWPGWYDIGKTDKNALRLEWETGADGFSCVFIEGGYTDVLDRYTAMTGRPIQPPKWALSPWRWRDEHRAGVLDTLDGLTVNADLAEDIKMYEKLGFPTGVYLIDRPWAEGTYGFGNFTFDDHRFPNAVEMIKKLHARGWRVVIWGSPWALGKTPTEFGYEARQKGWLMGDRCIDYTNPEALAWHFSKLEAFMRMSGIDGWKLDRSDEYNPSHAHDIYADGRTGVEVHNDYPRMYVKLYHDVSAKVRGDDFLIKSRPAYTGTTAWSFTYGGDIPGALANGAVSTDRGLRSAIIALQRNACMGYPIWGSDTGGYEGYKDREVFARWLEFSCFCPLMEIGGHGPHEPWAMPREPRYDEEVIQIYKTYTWLHAKLLDYTYELVRRGHATGNPIVHPLVFDWPGDAKVKNMWDEYMYGPALLVAPVWKTGARSREVYLPAGDWIDFWDRSQTHHGPVTISADAPLDRVPLYIKADQKGLLPAELR
jgi:alpha-D-xyloside xylohydrolase